MSPVSSAILSATSKTVSTIPSLLDIASKDEDFAQVSSIAFNEVG